jgi:UDP-N-acetylglucosamine--N-acetylmuramyl-(pentapeptide) pyrophosphoryl-undecaprenol N-acetylglucosamine transferase
MGTLNRLLKPYAKEFISSYDDNSKQTPYPIKEIYFKTARVRDSIKHIIFLGGSQGAKAINELALSLAPVLSQKGISITHQAGERNIDEVKKAYEEMGIDADVFGFTKDLPSHIAKADFAIARAGASTLWELSANGLPTIFIPYPYAVGDHQYYNAKYLLDKKLAWVMREGQIDKEKIEEVISSDISHISKALQESVDSSGAKEIGEILLDLKRG